MRMLGIALLVVGVVALAYGGFAWTTKEKVIDAGPIQISADKTRSLPLPPVVGIVCLVAGGLLLANGRKS